MTRNDIQVTVTIDDVAYQVDISPDDRDRRPLTVSVDGVWGGAGVWAGQIEDCPAVLPEGVYDALNDAIEDVLYPAVRA